MKHCRCCKVELSLDKFVKSKAFKSGFDTICLACSRQKVNEWRIKNREWHNKLNREYQKRNSSVVLAKTRRYQLTKKNRVPIWANVENIKTIYKNCPEGYHVDHIVPLQGTLVSGLHVENNLQYLPELENKSKGNTWLMN